MSDLSIGMGGTSSRESIVEGRKSSQGITVTKEDLMVSDNTFGFDPAGNTGLGHGVGFG